MMIKIQKQKVNTLLFRVVLNIQRLYIKKIQTKLHEHVRLKIVTQTLKIIPV